MDPIGIATGIGAEEIGTVTIVWALTQVFKPIIEKNKKAVPAVAVILGIIVIGLWTITTQQYVFPNVIWTILSNGVMFGLSSIGIHQFGTHYIQNWKNGNGSVNTVPTTPSPSDDKL